MVINLKKVLLVTALILAGGSTQVALGSPADADPAALAVAQSYFSALQSGDTEALLSLFSDKALMRNEAQLHDPDYSQFLVDRYRDASFEVTDGGERNGISFVDIKIRMNDAESIRERLIIKPSGDPADSSLHIAVQKELLD